MTRRKTRKASRPRRVKTTKQLRRKLGQLRRKANVLAKRRSNVFPYSPASQRASAAAAKIGRRLRKAAKPRKAKRAKRPRVVQPFNPSRLGNTVAPAGYFKMPKRAKRKSNRPPMSAAQREAFKRRMAEARARKAGNRGRRLSNARSEGFVPQHGPRAGTESGTTNIGTSRNPRHSYPNAKNPRRHNLGPARASLASRICGILRASGYSAMLHARPEGVMEIVTDAPEAVCAQAAAEAGA